MHNSRNSRGYGYMPSSSRDFSDRSDRYAHWNDETEWSASDETWRGNSNRNPPPDRGRHDSWKEPSPSPPPRNNLNFQLGKDRAPMPVDEQFLVRYGAKRMNNGNLIDRDGYTLRTRDPGCQAPSPPTYNPGRKMRRSGGGGDHVDRKSPNDMEKKARQQMEIMRRIEKEAERNDEISKNDRKRRQNKLKQKDEEEGEDEYEDVEPPPQPVKEARIESKPTTSPSYAHHLASIIAPAIAPPPPVSPRKTLLPMGPKKNSWFQQYKRNVETMKEQAYGPPASSTTSPGYFHQPDHALPPSNHYQPASFSTSSSFYSSSPSVIPPPNSFSASRSRTPSTSSASSPFYATPTVIHNKPPPPKPYQMDIPPPGVVGFEPPRYGVHTTPDPSNVNAFGVWTGIGVPPPPPKPIQQSSSDSESEEDEAIIKLREILRHHGPR